MQVGCPTAAFRRNVNLEAYRRSESPPEQEGGRQSVRARQQDTIRAILACPACGRNQRLAQLSAPTLRLRKTRTAAREGATLDLDRVGHLAVTIRADVDVEKASIRD